MNIGSFLMALAFTVPTLSGATSEPPEDPIAECMKQPRSKLLALEHSFDLRCPALEYFRESMDETQAYFTWCKKIIEGMNQLQEKKGSMNPKAFEQKRNFLAMQKAHLHSLVNSIASDVHKMCASETGPDGDLSLRKPQRN